MIQPSSIFVKTALKSVQRSEEYTYLIKVLDAFFQKIKVDDNLPQQAERDAFTLYLIDGTQGQWQDLLPADLITLAKNYQVVLFNVCPEQVCESTLLLNHFNGVFYKSAATEDIFKGLIRICAGELWFTRKVISKAFNDILSARTVFNADSSIVLSESAYSTLTKREKSVINLIAQGATNNNIADKLNISDHTVKTHLYSAFKKTHSRNRVELANWAQRYTSVLLPVDN